MLRAGTRVVGGEDGGKLTTRESANVARESAEENLCRELATKVSGGSSLSSPAADGSSRALLTPRLPCETSPGGILEPEGTEINRGTR